MSTTSFDELNEPLVSVVIPVYKVEDYLAGCISSVLGQSYRNIEIILVDDGSPDSSPAICDSYARLYDNIHVIHKENGGSSSARNAGMEMARGDYIMFVDSDDTIPEHALERLLGVAIDERCDVVVPDRYYKVWIDGKRSLCYHFPKELQTSDPRDFAIDVLIRHARAWRAHALLYAKQTLSDASACFPLGYTGEDFPFNLQVLGKARKIGFLEESTVNYLQRPGSITKTFNPDFFNTILYLDRCARSFIAEHPTEDGRGEAAVEILLCRNVVVYLISVYSSRSGLGREERDDLFERIVGDALVERALQVDFSNLIFSNRLAGKVCVLIKKALERGHFGLAKILLSAAGRF